jgi:predicted dithiol-disulfide oxidoreductase (DUF899 family)
MGFVRHNDFNYDFYVSCKPEEAEGEVYYNYECAILSPMRCRGLCVFANNAFGAVFHTYSVYARGRLPPVDHDTRCS